MGQRPAPVKFADFGWSGFHAGGNRYRGIDTLLTIIAQVWRPRCDGIGWVYEQSAARVAG
jgi:hypothetical protein